MDWVSRRRLWLMELSHRGSLAYIADQERFTRFSHVAGNALPQVDGKGFDFLFLFAGGGFENQFFGPAIQQQDRAGFGIQNAGGGFQYQFQQLFKVLG